jgi:hypothetical protein
MILKSENQDGGCPWCRTTDVTIQRNLIRNAGAGINVAPVGPHARVDSAPRRIMIRETVLEQIGEPPFNGDLRGFQFLTQTSHIAVERTVLHGKVNAALALEGGSPLRLRDNVWTRGQYGVIGSNKSPGLPTIDFYAPNADWAGMTFVGTQYGQYPLGTTWIATESASSLAAQIRQVVRNATAGVVTP